MIKIEETKDLTAFNTLHFRAVAEMYVSIESESDLLEAMDAIDQRACSFQVLSGGSNLLMAPRIKGMTLHIQNKGICLLSQDDSEVILRVSAGENWHALVKYTVEQSWQGLENLALIPGLVGAAPVQNIGAYGSELQDVLVKLRAFDTKEQKFIELLNQDCLFSYRDSLFKQQPGRYIITSLDIRLYKKTNIEYKYAAIKDYFSTRNVTQVKLSDVFDAICFIRSEKLPDPLVTPNAGSFFKNPVISRQHFNLLAAKYPKIVGYTVCEESVKVAAGWLIESCDWKGYSSDGVGVYAKQALVLIHEKEASLAQLLSLAQRIKQSVSVKYQIDLEIEPQHFPARD